MAAPLITPGILDAGLIWTSDDILALKASLRNGVLMVVYAGPPQRQVTYQSLSEMRSLLAAMIADVYGRRRSRLARVRKGFRDDETDPE